MCFSDIKNRLYIFMTLSIVLTAQLHANEFAVGFAKLSITPDLIDEWEDINNDAQFDADIDTVSYTHLTLPTICSV